MREVAQGEFYKAMGPLNVHPSIQPGPWPWTALWKDQRTDSVMGKTVDVIPEGGGLTVTHYFLNS